MQVERAEMVVYQSWFTPEMIDQRTGLPRHILEPEPRLIVLSGPSGVGKDSVLNRMKELGHAFHFVITATTRPQRPGEVHGRDYLFISEERYREWLAQGEFLEHATVYGYNYGVPKHQIRDAWARGQDVILRIDVQGAATIRKVVPQAIFIFLAAASLEELMRRLTERKTESGADLEKRMATARAEMERISDFDYVVVNHADNLDQAVRHILAIIRAEKCRVVPCHIEL